MSGLHDDELDPALEQALEALREERPDPRFRRELRARFVGARQARTPRRAWIAGALAAAAGLALALAWWRAGASAPAWSVVASQGDVTLDGRTLDAAELSAGGRLRTGPSARLQLVLGRRVALGLGPDSEIVLPAPEAADGAWLLEARSGHLAVRTGPEFAGSQLTVRAPDADVAVVGTRFAVDVYGEGTCVCCGAGRVDVRSRREGAAQMRVEPGGMAFAHAAGGFSTGEVLPDHAPALAALDALFE